MRVWQASHEGCGYGCGEIGGWPGVEVWMRGPISRLLRPLSTPGIAWHCPAERVGSGGGLPGGRLVRAVG